MRRSAPLLSLLLSLWLLGLVTTLAVVDAGLAFVPGARITVRSAPGADNAAVTGHAERARPLDHALHRSGRTHPSAGRHTAPPAMLATSGALDAPPAAAATLRQLAEAAVPAPETGGASLVAERLTYEPGAALRVRRRTEVRVIALEAGVLEVRLDGIAFLDRRWLAARLLAGAPNRIDGAVQVLPGELLVIPADTAFTGRNAGEQPAVSLDVSVRLPQPLTAMTDRASAGTEIGTVRRERLTATMATAPGEPATLTIGRVILPRDGSIDIEGVAGPVLCVNERGIGNATWDGAGAARALGDVEVLARGERVAIDNGGEAPFAILVLTITAAESTASTV